MVKIWTLMSHEFFGQFWGESQAWEIPEVVDSACFSPDGSRVLVTTVGDARRGSQVLIWNVDLGQIEQELFCAIAHPMGARMRAAYLDDLTVIATSEVALGKPQIRQWTRGTDGVWTITQTFTPTRDGSIRSVHLVAA